jgi:hypothetical protein
LKGISFFSFTDLPSGFGTAKGTAALPPLQHPDLRCVDLAALALTTGKALCMVMFGDGSDVIATPDDYSAEAQLKLIARLKVHFGSEKARAVPGLRTLIAICLNLSSGCPKAKVHPKHPSVMGHTTTLQSAAAAAAAPAEAASASAHNREQEEEPEHTNEVPVPALDADIDYDEAEVLAAAPQLSTAAAVLEVRANARRTNLRQTQLSHPIRFG